MDLLLNDLSIEGQFPDARSFCAALDRIVEMRNVARGFGSDLYCRQNIARICINPSTSVREALPREKKSAFMLWLNRQGPFWDDARKHGSDDYLLSGGEIVTDTAIGEAAYCSTIHIDRRLVSLAPSKWNYSPIVVTFTDAATDIEVANYWDLASLETALRGSLPRIKTCEQLEEVCKIRFQRLRFSEDSFSDLRRHFVPALVDNIISRLKDLDDLMGERDSTGNWRSNPTFPGGGAWFSDSSNREKNNPRDRQKLSFKHPDGSGRTLFCPWHGKLSHQGYPYRIHFTWPLSAGEPLYVVYVGPKLTIHG